MSSHVGNQVEAPLNFVHAEVIDGMGQKRIETFIDPVGADTVFSSEKGGKGEDQSLGGMKTEHVSDPFRLQFKVEGEELHERVVPNGKQRIDASIVLEKLRSQGACQDADIA